MSHALFDAIKKQKGIVFDIDLSVQLGLSKEQVNRYRSRQDRITPALILRIYDFTDLSIEQIRELAADTTTPRAPRVRSVKPAVPSNVTITKAPQWVSRVHRIA